MARSTAIKMGWGVCPDKDCGKPAYFKKSSGGSLTHQCLHCHSTGYAEENGKAYRRRLATVVPDEDDNNEPAAAPAAPPAPVAKKRESFNLGGL